MSGFELLDPRGLWLLSALAPLVLLYILKIRRERQRVPSTWLWAAAERDLLAKRPFRRLVAELPLVLQILALCLLALALARPARRGGAITGDHVAIVVDTSASMGTRERAGGTRMEAAKQAAIDIVSGLAPGADAIVIEASREARVVSALERDPARLRAAIRSLATRDVEGDLSPAVALAADRIRTLAGRGKIVIVTDGALARGGPLSASGLETQVALVGDAEDNAAIVRVDVRNGVDPGTKHEQVQLFAMVRNYGASPRDAFVTLTVEGKAEPVASRRILVPPNDKLPVVLAFEPGLEDQGKGLIVQLSPEDALPRDDIAYARVPASSRMPVVLASRATYSWVARAVDADTDVQMQRLGVEELDTVNVDPDALVIVEGACPAHPPGRDVLVVAPPRGSCFGLEVEATVEQPQLTSWESSDPRFRFLTLDGVHVARASPLNAEAKGALLRAGAEVLMADASVPGRTVTIVGFDPGDSDWPLEASFVLFVRNVLELARNHRAQGAVGAARTGDPIRIALPSGVTSVRVTGPDMPEHDVAAKGGFAVVSSVERAGLYRVKWTEPHVGQALVAANLTSERESDVRAHPIAFDAGATGGAASSPRLVDAHHELGLWLALAAALVIAADLFWLTRRARSVARRPG